MILWELFFTFFKIGLFTFGGGYAMIPLVLENVVNNGWMDSQKFYSLIGICESTPGPIAVNMATFIGSEQAGFWGSVCATAGVVLPSFLVILVIAALFRNFSKKFYVQSAFRGMRPVIFALIGCTGLLLAFENAFSSFPTLASPADPWAVDWFLLVVTPVLFLAERGYQAWRKKKLSSVLLIVIGALCGMLFG